MVSISTRTCLLIVDGSGLHLDCVVPVAQFSEAEAAYVVQSVNSGQQLVVMTLCTELQHSPTKQVKLCTVGRS